MPSQLETQLVHTASPVPVLLGAGASVSAGAGTGMEIARHIQQLVRVPDRRDPQRSRDLLVQFEDAMAALGGGLEVAGLHLRKYLEGLRPTRGHRALAKLVRQGYIGPVLLTTNFDPLIESALADEGVDVRVFIPSRDNLADLDKLGGDVCLIKVHGDASVSKSLRLRPEQVKRYPRKLEQYLVSLVREKGLLVVGHSLRDPDLLHVLDVAAPTHNFLGVADPSVASGSVDELLAEHGSANYTSDKDFDEFFSRLEQRVRRREIYSRHEADLELGWQMLDRCRFAGLPSRVLMPLLDRLPKTLAEVEALLGLHRHWEMGGTSPTELNEALRWLDLANSTRIDRDPAAQLRLAQRLLSESMLAVLAGEEVALGRQGRRGDLLADLVLEVELGGRVPGAERYPLALAGLELALGEAYKELYTRRSLLEDRREAKPNLKKSEEALKRALSLLGPESGDQSEWRIMLKAATQRHYAVVEEYKGALLGGARQGGEQARLWLQRSREAAALAAQVGERRVRGYALINVAASTVAVQVAESGPRLDEETVASAGAAIREAQEHLGAVRDERGLAWCHLHAARLLQRRIATLETASTESVGDLSRALEAEALTARRWARRAGNDTVAIGLANLYASYANVERAKTGLGGERKQFLAPLQAALMQAEESMKMLRNSHRLPQAARAAQLKAEACELLARHAEGPPISQALGDGVRLMAEAIEMLSRVQPVSEESLEQLFQDLSSTIERAVPKLGF